jgi:hypothetical protein
MLLSKHFFLITIVETLTGPAGKLWEEGSRQCDESEESLQRTWPKGLP